MSEPKLERCICNPLNDHWCDRTERDRAIIALAERAEHAERAQAAENLKGYDEGFRIAEQMTTREVNDLRTRLAEAEQRGHQIEQALADMIDVADRCAWYVVRATSTTPYEDRIRAARAMLTPGALSGLPPGVDKPAATMLGQSISMDDVKRISKDGP